MKCPNCEEEMKYFGEPGDDGELIDGYRCPACRTERKIPVHVLTDEEAAFLDGKEKEVQDYFARHPKRFPG